MNFKRIVSALAIAGAILCACEQPEDLSTPKITVTPEEITLDDADGSAPVEILATRNWYIASQPDWIALSVNEGKASGKPQQVNISASANAGYDRTGEVVFSIGLAKAALTVHQKGTQGELKMGSGTLEDPYTVAGVIAYVETLGKDVNSPGIVYVKGKVCRLGDETFKTSGTYGNATFWMSDNGEVNTTDFYCYRIKYLGNKKYTSGDDIAVGDDVIICGNVVNYKGNTPETVQNSAYLYSLNGTTGGSDTPAPTPGTPSGSGTQSDPYNVAAAVKAVSGLSWTSKDDYQKVGPYYVKGKVSAIDQDYTYNISDGRNYGNARFTISDDGATSSEQFTLYNLDYLGGTKFTAGKTDIKVGDDVVIYAELQNYHGDTPENTGGYLYSLNGDTGSSSSETVTGTVAQTIATSDNTKVVIAQAQVAGKSNYGFVVSDATGSVYLYFKKDETIPSVNIGDNVKVEATKTTYGGVPEFTGATVTVLSSGSFSYPEAKDITSTAASYASSVTEYVSINGTLKVSGNYYNLEIPGASTSTVQGSLSAPLESLGVDSFEGKQVTVKGYFVGTSSNKDCDKYINILVTGIGLADPNAKYCGVSTDNINVKADVTEASFSISSNAAWTAVSDNAAFTLDPASGEGDATVTVKFSANEGDAPRVANIKVSCPDAGYEATVVLTQAKPSSGEAVTISIDFTKKISSLPQKKENAQKDGTFEYEGYTFTLHAADAYYQGESSGSFYLLIGKTGSYIEFPAIEGKSLVKVSFLTGANASPAVIEDIAKADGTRLNINNSALNKGTEFEWDIPGEPGVAYRIVVCNDKNAQFQNLTLIYE